MTLRFSLSSHSDRGRSPVQHDRFLQAPFDGGLLVAVMDGVGKRKEAGVASESVRCALEEYISRNAQVAKETPVSALHQASARAIASLAHTVGATTCTALLLLEDGRAAVGHIGDCVAFRCREGVLSLLAKPDRSEEGLRTHSLHREVTGPRTATAGWRAWMEKPSEPGDVYLLASDGCWESVRTAGLKRTLTAPEPWERAAEDLVRASLDAGSTDNITVVLVRVELPGREALPEA